jgi:serine/threonine protein kinase
METDLKIKTALAMPDSEFSPQVLQDDCESTEQGLIVLKELLATSVKSVVMLGARAKKPHTEYVLKYSAAPGNILRMEFGFLSALQDSKLVPHVHSVSSEVKFDVSTLYARKIRKISRRVKDLKEKRLGLRFMVMEPLGHSLDEYLVARSKKIGRKGKYLHEVLNIGTTLIMMLRDLHKRGIVHNDIHGNNVVFAKRKELLGEYNPLLDELRFIDFEHSVFYPDFIGKPVKYGPSPMKNVLLMSPWALQGERTGRRDDVYSLIETLAVFLSNFELDKHLLNFMDSRESQLMEAALEYKTQCKLFEYDPQLDNQCCVYDNMAEETQDFVRRSLQKLINHVRTNESHPDKEPDYSYVISTLKGIDEMVFG